MSFAPTYTSVHRSFAYSEQENFQRNLDHLAKGAFTVAAIAISALLIVKAFFALLSLIPLVIASVIIYKLVTYQPYSFYCPHCDFFASLTSLLTLGFLFSTQY